MSTTTRKWLDPCSSVTDSCDNTMAAGITQDTGPKPTPPPSGMRAIPAGGGGNLEPEVRRTESGRIGRWSRIRLIVGAALSVSLLIGMAQAAEWTLLGKGHRTGSDSFVDTSSIQESGDIRRAWVKAVWRPHTYRRDVDSGKWVLYSVIHEAYNCAQKTNRRDVIISYYEDGSNERFGYPDSQWEPVAPGTVDAGTMNFICGWKP